MSEIVRSLYPEDLLRPRGIEDLVLVERRIPLMHDRCVPDEEGRERIPFYVPPYSNLPPNFSRYSSRGEWHLFSPDEVYMGPYQQVLISPVEAMPLVERLVAVLEELRQSPLNRHYALIPKGESISLSARGLEVQV